MKHRLVIVTIFLVAGSDGIEGQWVSDEVELAYLHRPDMLSYDNSLSVMLPFQISSLLPSSTESEYHVSFSYTFGK